MAITKSRAPRKASSTDEQTSAKVLKEVILSNDNGPLGRHVLLMVNTMDKAYRLSQEGKPDKECMSESIAFGIKVAAGSRDECDQRFFGFDTKLSGAVRLALEKRSLAGGVADEFIKWRVSASSHPEHYTKQYGAAKEAVFKSLDAKSSAVKLREDNGWISAIEAAAKNDRKLILAVASVTDFLAFCFRNQRSIVPPRNEYQHPNLAVGLLTHEWNRSQSVWGILSDSRIREAREYLHSCPDKAEKLVPNIREDLNGKEALSILWRLQ